MGFAVAIGFLLLCMFEYTKHKAWVAPSVIFSGYWAFVSFLATLRLYNINSVNLKTWLVILIGVLSFVGGTKIIIVDKKRVFNIQSNQLILDKDCFIATKVYWILFIIVGIYVTKELIQSIRLLSMNVPLAAIRRASFGLSEIEGFEYSKSFFAGFVRRLMSGLGMVLIAAGIDLFFENTKKNIIYMLAAVYLTLGPAISAGGRWILMYFLIMLIGRQNISLNHRSIFQMFSLSRKKIKLIFLTIIIFAIILYAFSQISTERAGEDADWQKILYYYICGCIPFLEVKMNEIDQIGIYSFLFAGQYGLWSYVIPVLIWITGYDFPLFSQTVENVMNAQQSRYIGGGIDFNAFTTPFYYLYADFRFLGVFLGMFVYGIIAGTLYKKAKTTDSPFVAVPYLVILATIVNSLHTYLFESTDHVIAFVFMLIVYILLRYKFRLK